MRIFLVSLLILLASCRPPDNAGQGATEGSGDVRVRLELAGEPTVGPADVRVYLLGSDNEALTGASVTVTGNMSHAGMEPVIAEANEAESGLYETEDFTFTMAGDWILQADVTLPDGGEVQGETTLTVPGD